MKNYYVYILSNNTGTLYVGVTNDINRRIAEHKANVFAGFSKKYKINKLVYLESTPDIEAAIGREKQLKGWRREKKLDLISKQNPGWLDLSMDPSTLLGMTTGGRLTND